MLLSEVFEYLNYGELAQVILGNANDGGISEENYPELLTHVNLGLISLYSKFTLRENSAIVQMDAAINTYKLKTDFASTSASAEPVKYILDSVAEPFEGKVLKIHKVESSNPEVDIILNDHDAPSNKVMSLTHDTIKVYSPDAAHTLTVHYREGPDKIASDITDPSLINIPLPETLLEPLLYFIAARAHARTPALDGQESKSVMYANKYRAAVTTLKNENIIESHHIANDRIQRDGWV